MDEDDAIVVDDGAMILYRDGEREGERERERGEGKEVFVKFVLSFFFSFFIFGILVWGKSGGKIDANILF